MMSSFRQYSGSDVKKMAAVTEKLAAITGEFDAFSVMFPRLHNNTQIDYTCRKSMSASHIHGFVS
jgi:hypothetical protein